MEEKTERSESGHHHHHHHHHRKKRTWKDKVRHFLKKYKKECQISAVAGAVVLVLMLFVTLGSQQAPAQTNPQESQSQSENGDIQVSFPAYMEPVVLVNDAVAEYMNSDISVTVHEIKAKYEHERFDLCQPVELYVQLENLPGDVFVRQSQLELAEGDSFVNAIFYNMEDNGTIQLTNLKTGVKYSYRVHFTLSDGRVLTYGSTFETAAGPRMMTIEGIYNVRDIGGWPTADGKIIRQGLLYRGSEIDSAVENTYKLTEVGIDEMIRNLGIKLDMDLRAPEDRMPGRYILGSNVEHRYYQAQMYSAAFQQPGMDALREVFRDLAKPENYPIYLHCTYGCDRTGTVCYLLNALLGVSENDLIRDYELSAFFAETLQRENIQTVYNALQSYQGFTLQGKAANFLLSIGVTAEEIASIREIFLGK